MDRLSDQDRFVDELDQVILRARLARFTGAKLDETQVLALAHDAADTAAALSESAIAHGDAADAIAAVDGEPVNLLAS